MAFLCLLARFADALESSVWGFPDMVTVTGFFVIFIKPRNFVFSSG